ncbi:hypothetical protein [Halobaculum sp. P14]|uniref:hypothetical protein n=1 Tax=Halobaculum sp. P14 TaxID=3421638 RepID=UPI003EC1023E
MARNESPAAVAAAVVPSARSTERALATLLLALLGAYAAGTVVGAAAPTVDAVGVVAVHVAAAVGVTLPVAVLGRAALSRLRERVEPPETVDSVVALAVVGCLLALLLPVPAAASTALFGAAAVGAVALACHSVAVAVRG